jgi:hypothetical protein
MPVAHSSPSGNDELISRPESSALARNSHVMAENNVTCGNCGLKVSATVVQVGERVSKEAAGIWWLLCPNCMDGCVRTKDGSVWPVAPVLANITGLPSDVAGAWKEAQAAHVVAAYTASEMMCRKILMHLAVDVADGKEGGTFKRFIEDLDKAGYISTGLKPAIEKIKDRGNTANHELPASTAADSLMTLRITEHLLRAVYEIPGL